MRASWRSSGRICEEAAGVKASLYNFFFFSRSFCSFLKKKKAQRQREHRAATETDEVKKKIKRGLRGRRVVVRKVLGVSEKRLIWVLARGR